MIRWPSGYDEVVIEGGFSPEGGYLDVESFVLQDGTEEVGCGVMGGGGFHPECAFGEEVAEPGDEEAEVVLFDAAAEDEFASGADFAGGGA